MDILKQELSEEDLLWCKRWANRYSNIVACLTNKSDFTEHSLAKLIYYEATHLSRLDLLHRMMARYSKLRRKREWQELLDYMMTGGHDERERKRHRKILMRTSRGEV